MKAVPVAALSNVALSWSVAAALYPDRILKVTPHYITQRGATVELETSEGSYRYLRFTPHANARHGNPIIRRLGIRVIKNGGGKEFMATETGDNTKAASYSGATRLESAMRCVVGNRKWLVVHVPEFCFQ